jgi:hypothetical protein
MKIGMLWLDDDKQRSLDEKVERAVEHYREKYGRLPELCFVNPNMVGEGMQRVGKVEVRPFPQVQPHYFWLGMSQS